MTNKAKYFDDYISRHKYAWRNEEQKEIKIEIIQSGSLDLETFIARRIYF